MRPIRRIGRTTVVRAGHRREASGLSSKPTTETCLPISRPASRTAWQTPAAISSLPQKMAVGGAAELHQLAAGFDAGLEGVGGFHVEIALELQLVRLEALHEARAAFVRGAEGVGAGDVGDAGVAEFGEMDRGLLCAFGVVRDDANVPARPAARRRCAHRGSRIP